MISYAKALRLIKKNTINLKNEKIFTIDSINRVSAENVLSPNNKQYLIHDLRLLPQLHHRFF